MKQVIKKILSKIGLDVVRTSATNFDKKTNSPKNIVKSNVSSIQNIPLSTTVQHSEIHGDVRIGERCLIYKVNLSGDIQIGNNTSINGPGTEFFSSVNKIKIGNFCSIARHTAIQDHNHNIHNITTYFIKYHIFKESNRNQD